MLFRLYGNLGGSLHLDGALQAQQYPEGYRRCDFVIQFGWIARYPQRKLTNIFPL